MAGVKEIASQEDYENLLKKPNLIVIHFYAEWALESQPMNEVLDALSKEDEFKGVIFSKIQAETFPKISVEHKINAVPTFLFFLGGKQVDRLDGANAAKLTQMVKNNNAKAQLLAEASVPVISQVDSKPPESSSSPVTSENLNDTLKRLINQSPIMLFMKGSPQDPQCGFSRQAIALLQKESVKFGSFDIMSDERVRQGLKTYSNWPTYPQLYVNGELIGGLDIMKELAASGELSDTLKPKSNAEPLEERLKRLTHQAPVMVFMKGEPAVPRCGFSRQLVDILNSTNIPYQTFDILGDEEVRQGLKTFSNWPTYPQVYVNGNLVGGLDIIKELREGGELLSALKGE